MKYRFKSENHRQNFIKELFDELNSDEINKTATQRAVDIVDNLPVDEWFDVEMDLSGDIYSINGNSMLDIGESYVIMFSDEITDYLETVQ